MSVYCLVFVYDKPQHYTLVFTAGISENSAVIRETISVDIEHLSIACDRAKNQALQVDSFAIHAGTAPVNILIIPTYEELEIAQQTIA